MSLRIPHLEAFVESWDAEHESSAPQYAHPCIDAEPGPEVPGDLARRATPAFGPTLSSRWKQLYGINLV